VKTDHVDAQIRVRYAETDQMGIVYHANYLVWFEIGRVELLRSRGLPYRELEEREGCFIVVTRANATFHAPARYDDLLTVRTRIKRLNSRLVEFEYEMFDEAGKKIATGETAHLVTDRNGKPRRLPDQYLKDLEGE
jgi:acyl-CoA thioester hydrolase